MRKNPVTSPLAAFLQKLSDDGCELSCLLRRQFSQKPAPFAGKVRCRVAVGLKYEMIEKALPNIPLSNREIRDCDDGVEQAMKWRNHGLRKIVPPIIYQNIERRQGSNCMPPHVGNEDRVTRFQFRKLGRSGRRREARVAGKVWMEGIDQAYRHA